MSSTPESETEPEPSPANGALDAEPVDGRADRLRDRHRGELGPTELVEVVESRRTIGELEVRDPTPRQAPAIPTEVLESDARRADSAYDPTPSGSLAVVRRRVWLRVLQAGFVLFGLSVVYYLISLYQVWSVGRADQLEPVDAIVVMGAAQYDGRPSPQLAARLDHVVELWPQGYAPLVVVTGGNLPGDRFTEASASADYLIERGVPDDVILREDEGSNSFESLEATAALLEARGLDEVLIVTDPYHALRSRETAEELGLTARVSSTDTSVVQGSDAAGRHLQEAAGVAVGRIIGFERLSNLVD
jgi:uncharacterized SAM-binding protein YcdF (DUF218 family)